MRNLCLVLVHLSIIAAASEVRGDWRRLWYFDARGRAEPIRLALAAAGLQFEEIFVSKNSTGGWVMDPEVPGVTLPDFFPYRQVPVYEESVNGNYLKLAQSNAILRHIARKHGLYGTDPLHVAYVDEILYAVDDIRAHLGKIFYPSVSGGAVVQSEQTAALKSFRKNSLPKFVGGLMERIFDIDSFLSGDRSPPFPAFGHAIDRRLTVADFAVAGALEGVAAVVPDLFTRIPAYACLIARMFDHAPVLSRFLSPTRPAPRPLFVAVGSTGPVAAKTAANWERAIAIMDPWALIDPAPGAPGSATTPLVHSDVRAWVDKVQRLRDAVPQSDSAALRGDLARSTSAAGAAYVDALLEGDQFADAVCSTILDDLAHLTLRSSADPEHHAFLSDPAEQLKIFEKIGRGEINVKPRKRYDQVNDEL